MKIKYLKLILFFIVTQSLNYQAQAAACCGGGSQLPALITSDDRVTFNYGVSYGKTVVDSVNGEGIWVKNEDHLQTTTYKFESAYVFDNDWQIGSVIPYINKNYLGETYSGLSDVQVHAGYEILPEREFSLYQPKGFIFVGTIFPTGQSQYTSEHSGMDSRGKEQWGHTLGVVLVKSWVKFDALAQIEGHYYYPQKIKSAKTEVHVSSLWGNLIGVGVGYNTAKWRWGVNLQAVTENPQKVMNESLNESGYREQYMNFSLSTSYLLSENQTLALSYADQTLFGEPKNTSLSKSLALQFNQRYSR